MHASQKKPAAINVKPDVFVACWVHIRLWSSPPLLLLTFHPYVHSWKCCLHTPSVCIKPLKFVKPNKPAVQSDCFTVHQWRRLVERWLGENTPYQTLNPFIWVSLIFRTHLPSLFICAVALQPLQTAARRSRVSKSFHSMKICIYLSLYEQQERET